MPSVIIQKVKHERAAEVARARAANALASQSVKAKNVRAQALRHDDVLGGPIWGLQHQLPDL